jgi:hypothetical protein
MSTDVFRSIGSTAGLAGLAIGMIVILFKEVIRKRIFPQLPTKQAYQLLRTILFLAWSIAIVGIGSWTYLQLSARPIGQPPESAAAPEPQVIAGTVVDETNTGVGQAEIAIAGLKDVFTSEDSGNFRISLPPGQAPAQRVRLSVAKKGYQPLDTSVLPPVENLILMLRKK